MSRILKKRQFRNLLAIAYLSVALVVTAATSSPSNMNGSEIPPIGFTNYSVRSTCMGAPDVIAVRVDTGLVRSSLSSSGIVASPTQIDFMQLGFPHGQVSVGVMQKGQNDLGIRQCRVKGVTTMTNHFYNAEPGPYWFAQQGLLTTTEYTCTQNGAFDCTISLSELPAGDLAAGWQLSLEN